MSKFSINIHHCNKMFKVILFASFLLAFVILIRIAMTVVTYQGEDKTLAVNNKYVHGQHANVVINSSYLENDKVANTTTNSNGSADISTIGALKNLIPCKDREFLPQILQHGDYWLFKNFARMDGYVSCFETVTYTTHSDFTFLDNIVPLLERWEAPLSIAIYAPGTDFKQTVNNILFLRNCHQQAYLVQQFATFHVFFDSRFYPEDATSDFEALEKPFSCIDADPLINVMGNGTFRALNNLTYPVNVGRNLAKEAALTHYVLASDIELYPNVGLADDFLTMIQKQDESSTLWDDNNVFVLPIFEVDESELPPADKRDLRALCFHEPPLALWFHFKICPTCHMIPKGTEWLRERLSSSMKVFTTAKRQGSFSHWEPIFIGSRDDPEYDERLSWEGKSDKMTQAYVLCLKDFNFHILSNGFLVHKPGIKSIKQAARPKQEASNKEIILKKILPEIKLLYGTRSGCKMYD